MRDGSIMQTQGIAVIIECSTRQCLSTVKDVETVAESHERGNDENVTGNQNRVKYTHELFSGYD